MKQFLVFVPFLIACSSRPELPQLRPEKGTNEYCHQEYARVYALTHKLDKARKAYQRCKEEGNTFPDK